MFSLYEATAGQPRANSGPTVCHCMGYMQCIVVLASGFVSVVALPFPSLFLFFPPLMSSLHYRVVLKFILINCLLFFWGKRRDMDL